MRPEQYHWDEMKIGPGAPPIKTEQGWLSIYHGVFQTMDGSVYRLGVALHDLANPAQVIGVSDSWILQPEDPWEVTGYVHNVVFTCGAVAEPDGTVKIYWGGADTVMCVGEANISDLVALCLVRNEFAALAASWITALSRQNATRWWPLRADLAPARWIWMPCQRVLPNTFTLFRREITLSAKPRSATLWIAADSRYRLTVNGQRVQWGPAPCDPRQSRCGPG
jgi:hypothetical protein